MQSVITYNKNIQLGHIVYQTNIAAVTANELKVHNKLYQTQLQFEPNLELIFCQLLELRQGFFIPNKSWKFWKFFVSFTKLNKTFYNLETPW